MKSAPGHFTFLVAILVIAACSSTKRSITKLSPVAQCEILVSNKPHYKFKSLPRRKAQRTNSPYNTRKETVFTSEIKRKTTFQGVDEPRVQVNRIQPKVVLTESNIDQPVNTQSSTFSNVAENGDLHAGTNSTKIDYNDYTTAEVIESSKNEMLTSVLVLATLISALGLKFNRKNIRSVSRWAARNPVTARSMIAGLQAGKAIGAVALGHLLYQNGYMVSTWAEYGAIAAFTAAACMYPSQADLSNFIRRKALDVALIGSSAVMLTYMGNHYTTTSSISTTADPVTYSSNRLVAADYLLEKNDFNGDDKPVSDGFTPAEKAILILLLLLGFVGLSLLLAGLACTIACNGSDVLAVVVFVGGEAGLIALLVAGIKKIFSKSRKQKIREQLKDLENAAPGAAY